MWSVNCAENDVKLNIDVMDDYINAKGKQLEGTVNSETKLQVQYEYTHKQELICVLLQHVL